MLPSKDEMCKHGHQVAPTMSQTVGSGRAIVKSSASHVSGTNTHMASNQQSLIQNADVQGGYSFIQDNPLSPMFINAGSVSELTKLTSTGPPPGFVPVSTSTFYSRPQQPIPPSTSTHLVSENYRFYT